MSSSFNLFSDEIFVFTPTGDLKKLPTGSTALDFAFDIHTDIGAHCIGAKVNHRLGAALSQLKSGDQVEILTSSKQKPKEDWLTYVVTSTCQSKNQSRAQRRQAQGCRRRQRNPGAQVPPS
jgi:GTP pyrophosphokinase